MYVSARLEKELFFSSATVYTYILTSWVQCLRFASTGTRIMSFATTTAICVYARVSRSFSMFSLSQWRPVTLNVCEKGLCLSLLLALFVCFHFLHDFFSFCVRCSRRWGKKQFDFSPFVILLFSAARVCALDRVFFLSLCSSCLYALPSLFGRSRCHLMAWNTMCLRNAFLV